MRTKVESPIIEHVVIMEHFSKFYSFLTKLSDFCVIVCAN
jgi:hypothetical protein